MMTTPVEYYQALIARKSEYEGVFYVGVKTTSVFCRPTCPARKPKFENCTFFKTAQQALSAGFRPCKRCHPLSAEEPVFIQKLIEAVESHPDKKWRSDDLREFCIDPSTARRQFKKRFGMTFTEYARARRIGLALKQLTQGESVIDAQLTAGYESGSGFREAFSRIIGTAPAFAGQSRVLEAAWFDTRLGLMMAIADEKALYLLEFVDRQGLTQEIERLSAKVKATIIPGRPHPIQQVEEELHHYFMGQMKDFTTPILPVGTPFQRLVWETLQKIPFGETCSYSEVAAALGKPSSVRAVAQANRTNPLVILIPCHRVIGAHGDLRGYGGGLIRKKWLIEHESAFAKTSLP